LTEALLATGCEVLAIEMDRRLFEFLERRFLGANKLALVQADALELLRSRRCEPAGGWSDWKLVANLPYSVASPILVELALGATCPASIVVTLQDEVARRLVARAGTPDYGALSLLVQLRYAPKETFKIPATCFFPPPEVDSACVTLARRSPAWLAAELIPVFTKIVKRGFSQRRKMMLKLLKADWPAEKLDAAFGQLKLSPQVRAEAVSLEQFVELTRALARTR
jgi:16S rRNA (adenine1518-N6/adenine1519-N6)-dimethyltransferase